MVKFINDLKKLIEQDLEKHMSRPVINRYLWICLLTDFLLIQFIIGPFTVCIWRGAWRLYDEFFMLLFPAFQEWVIGIFCMSLGTSISCFVALYYREIDSLAKRARSTRYFLVSRIYSIFKFLTALLYWKGVFDILDYIVDKEHNFYIPHFTVTLCACLLFIIGAFKSAAITPPLGVNLDTQDDYISISTFYGSNSEDEWMFRALDAFWTTLIEVISTAAFWGAWGTGKYLFGSVSSSTRDALMTLVQAHVCSLIVFISQFFYLYLHYKSKAACIIKECKDLFYSVILVISLFATAFYIRGWWDLLDMISAELVPNYHNLELALTFSLGFIVMIVMGTASYNHFGVAREGLREKEGILLPFFYLTYYLRNRDNEVETKVFKAHDAKFYKLIKMWNSKKSKEAKPKDEQKAINDEVVVKLEENPEESKDS